MMQATDPENDSPPQADNAPRAAANPTDVPRVAPAAGERAVHVRNTLPADITAVRELQRMGYPTIRPWSVEHFENQLKVFPEGQFVAEMRGAVVGAASSLIVQWDDYAVDHTLKEVTGSGTFSTHDLRGRTLYGAEVIVSTKLRGSGVGRALYRARRQLCTRFGLRRIIAGGRLPGYHKYADTLTPEMYAMRVVWGDIIDPVLRFQMSQGFHYCGILRNYLPEDAESCGYAALIVWLNPHLARRARLLAQSASSPKGAA
jgi:ribosomal protein S18 acetylase RimI-like enzyme